MAIRRGWSCSFLELVQKQKSNKQKGAKKKKPCAVEMERSDPQPCELGRPDVVDSITTSDPISDHCGVFARLSLRRPPNSPLRSLCLPDYERTDWTALRTTIHNLPLFEAIQGTTDVDVAWQVWRGLVWNAVLQHVSFRTITIRPKNKFWMNSYLHKLSRRKLRLFRAATRQQTQVAWDAYKSFRNFCNAEFTRAKKQYTKRQQNTLQSETDGSRTWWTKAKRLSRISTPQTSLPTLKCPETDTIADTPPEKAELLANFFATQCTSPTPPMTFPVGAPYPLPEEHPMFDFPLITEHTVMRCLRRLPPSKSSGCSVLSHRVLRETAPAVCASLTYLYNLSIKTGTFPNDWKTAVVTPISRIGEKQKTHPTIDQSRFSLRWEKSSIISKAKPFVDTWSTGTFLQNTSSASFRNARPLNNSYTSLTAG